MVTSNPLTLNKNTSEKTENKRGKISLNNNKNKKDSLQKR